MNYTFSRLAMDIQEYSGTARMENNVVEIILPFALEMTNVYFSFTLWMYPAGARPTNFSLCEIAMQGTLLSNNHAYNYYAGMLRLVSEILQRIQSAKQWDVSVELCIP
jgi:hypothetical protein